MNDLLEKKCVPCEGGVKAFDISEIHKYQKKVDGWEIIQNDKKVYLLEKKFEFKIDESLIGGSKIQLGSLMIDSSIKNKLSKYQNE